MGMSALLAFGTGALGAVNKGFDRIAAARAKQADIDAEQEVAMERLGYQRDTSLMTARQEAEFQKDLQKTLMAGNQTFQAAQNELNRAGDYDRAIEVANISAGATQLGELARSKKNYMYIGPDKSPYFKILRSADGKDQSRNIIESFSDEAQLQAAIEGGELENIKRKIAGVVSTFPEDFGVYRTNLLNQKILTSNPRATEYFKPLMQNNPTLRNLFLEAESKKYVPSQNKNNAVAQMGVNGSVVEQTASPKLKTALNAAVNAYANGRKPGEFTGKMPEKIAKFMNNNGIYSNNKKDHKYFYFGANRAIMQILQGDSSNVNPRLITEARAWLTDPDNGFVDENENGEITGLNDAFYKAYEIYGKSNDYPEGNYVYGQVIPDETMTQLQEAKGGENIRKKIAKVAEVQDQAVGASKTIDKLIEQTDLAGTGSGMLINAQIILGAIPALARDELPGIFRSHERTKNKTRRDGITYFKEKKGYTYQHIKADGTKEERKATTVSDRIANAFTIVDNKKSIAAAKIEALQIILAYQMTSILQGGTGGRTISDQDITRTLKLFSGNLLNKEQKLSKLYYLREVIQDTLNRGKLYGPVMKPRNNSARWNTLVRVEALVNDISGQPYDIDNIETRIANKMNKRIANLPYNKHIGPQTSESVVNLIQKKSPASTFNSDQFEAWAEDTVRPLTGNPVTSFRVLEHLDSGRKFIYDYDSRVLILNAKDNKAKRKNIIDKQTTNFVYEVDTNKPLKIKWDVNDPNAGFDIIDEAKIAATIKTDVKRRVIPGAVARLTIPDAKTKLFSKGNVPTPGRKPLVHFTESDERLPYKEEEFPNDNATQNEANTASLLKQLGYSTAGINAILFNISKEGGFSQNELGLIEKIKGQFGSKVDETNVGALQWKGSRLDSYVKWAGDNPINNLFTSIRYMIKELTEGEEGGINREKYVALDKLLKEGTLPWEQLAHEFARVYLRPEILKERGTPIAGTR